MIHVEELSKRYRGVTALDRLSLTIPDGAVFGLLGPNGAGKTTLLRLLMGLIFPDGGQIDRGGLHPARIGYLPERAFYPPRFTIREYLTSVGRLAGLQGTSLRATLDQLIALLGLQSVAGRRLGACSRGMLQRVGLAQALIGDPPLLLLDEPAQGLDPAGQKFMRDQILAVQAQGRTVLLSSHHLDEVTRVCTDIAVISQGHLVRSGPLASILAPRRQVIIGTSPLAPELGAALEALGPGIATARRQVILTGEGTESKVEVLRTLLAAGIDIRHLSEQRANLEEIYLEATGK
ncbi:MAG: ATP-binding cassette domain-containing protein [Anaerolineae bacterium]|jgi:ABC-2 type transport system ATP-binding protein